MGRLSGGRRRCGGGRGLRRGEGGNRGLRGGGYSCSGSLGPLFNGSDGGVPQMGVVLEYAMGEMMVTTQGREVLTKTDDAIGNGRSVLLIHDCKRLLKMLILIVFVPHYAGNRYLEGKGFSHTFATNYHRIANNNVEWKQKLPH